MKGNNYYTNILEIHVHTPLNATSWYLLYLPKWRKTTTAIYELALEAKAKLKMLYLLQLNAI